MGKGKKYRADMAGDIAVREAPHLLPFSYLALRTNCLLCEALKKLVISDWNLQRRGR